MMEPKVRFLPFHAINEYMLDAYRQLVIQSVLGNFSRLSEERQRKISSLIKKYVKVQGFRNSSVAPLPLKVNGCIDTYKKSPEFVAQVLSAWTEIHKPLSEVVYGFLETKSWKLLPLEADRSVLPGFMLEWPKEETFEVLIQAFREEFPEMSISDDDISLSMVWLSNRLPYEYVDGLFKEEES
ncbi:MAG TPA: hypothetical protein VK856_13460 [Anaerolineaceae bacterium]|nr:hypothetical protein [Anaerolineaceae bacterium]